MWAGSHIKNAPQMKRIIVKNKKQFQRFVASHNGKANVYTTVYDFEEFSETAKVDSSVILNRIFFDFDAHEDELAEAWEDTKCMISFLKDANYNLFFSGRGFHLFVHGEPTDTIRNIQFYFRKAKNYLESIRGYNTTLDDRVGQTTRLRRMPNTVNMSATNSRGEMLFCIPLCEDDLDLSIEEILNLATKPRSPAKKINGSHKIVFPISPPLREIEGEVNVPKTIGSMPILPCLYNAIMTENPSHLSRAYLVSWYRDLISGYQDLKTMKDKEDTLNLIVDELERVFASSQDVWLDWDKTTTKNHAKFTVYGNYNTPHCDKLINEGLCIGKCWRYSSASD